MKLSFGGKEKEKQYLAEFWTPFWDNGRECWSFPATGMHAFGTSAKSNLLYTLGAVYIVDDIPTMYI